jgi:hypothetical protein
MLPLPELLYGPYAAPAVRRGDTLSDEALGWVKVGGVHDAPIPWPYMRARGRHRLILCGDLVRAVRTEAAIVVGAWWGVAPVTVWKWRKTLGVGHITPGGSERKAASKRGVPRPAHVKAMLDRTGRTRTAEARAKMAVAHRRRKGVPQPHLPLDAVNRGLAD